MNRRSTAIALIAGALLTATPAVAQARPLPDPQPQHLTHVSRDALLSRLAQEYRVAPLSEKRRLHNEITLITHGQFTL